MISNFLFYTEDSMRSHQSIELDDDPKQNHFFVVFRFEIASVFCSPIIIIVYRLASKYLTLEFLLSV